MRGNCSICKESLGSSILSDEDSQLESHIHCFFDNQKWLECCHASEDSCLIRQNPLNKKWYIYDLQNEWKHAKHPVNNCPWCGTKL